jgi:hypothetical protein
LKRDRPNLASRVEAGDLSANAAAIEAGFRPKTATVPLTVDGVFRAFMKLSDPEHDAVLARFVAARPRRGRHRPDRDRCGGRRYLTRPAAS